MSNRLCPLCFKPIAYYIPFCSECWKSYPEELKLALKERPAWLHWIQADAAKESDRRQKERDQGQLINDY